MKLLLTTAIPFYLHFLFPFCQPINYTKNWHSEDKPGHILASFDEFNGKQDFKLDKIPTGVFMLKYSVSLEKGKLSIEFKNTSKTTIKREISGKVTDSIRVDNTLGKSYKLTFKAIHAKGKFDIKY